MKTSVANSFKPKFTGEWILVTPEMAKEWLDNHNTHNRPLSMRRARSYSRDMESQSWLPSPEPVSFNCDGTLIDGQTRLMAVTLAGVSVWFWVFKNVPKDVAKVIDSGASRTASDAIKITRGEVVSSRLFAAAKTVLYRGKEGVSSPTRSERIADYDRFAKEIQQAVDMLSEVPRGYGRLSSGVVVGSLTRALVCGKDPKKVETFARVLATGMASDPDDKIIIDLRDKLMSPTKFTTYKHATGVFDRVTATLDAWLRGLSTVRIRPGVNLFPLPEELDE